jgi:hypothetical protein
LSSFPFFINTPPASIFFSKAGLHLCQALQLAVRFLTPAFGKVNAQKENSKKSVYCMVSIRYEYARLIRPKV